LTTYTCSAISVRVWRPIKREEEGIGGVGGEICFNDFGEINVPVYNPFRSIVKFIQ